MYKTQSNTFEAASIETVDSTSSPLQYKIIRAGKEDIECWTVAERLSPMEGSAYESKMQQEVNEDIQREEGKQ